MTQALQEPAAVAVQNRDEVISRLRAKEPAVRALGATALYLFGSAARDEMTGESDIDLYFDYVRERGFDYFALCNMERLLAGALARPVDLVARYGLHPVLRAGIEASALKIF